MKLGYFDENGSKKDIHFWIAELDLRHQDRICRFLHMICIPIVHYVIYASIWKLSFDFLYNHYWINLCILVMFFCSINFAFLSKRIFLCTSLFFLLEITLMTSLQNYYLSSFWQIHLAALLLGMILTAIAHKFEGPRPDTGNNFMFKINTIAWTLNLFLLPIGFGLRGKQTGRQK